MSNRQQRQEDGAMGTSKQREQRILNNFLNEQRTCGNVAIEDRESFFCKGINAELFSKAFFAAASSIMKRRGVYREFVVDDDNRDFLQQLYFYMAQDKRCKWHHGKGIFLGGKIGCGKTLIMQAYCEVLHFACAKIVKTVRATEIYDYIRNDKFDILTKGPLLLDDVGREATEVNAFGNVVHPFCELMERRYDNGALTFFTSNFKISTLSLGDEKQGRKGYGRYIGERIQEMANIVVLPGGNRRENCGTEQW